MEEKVILGKVLIGLVGLMIGLTIQCCPQVFRMSRRRFYRLSAFVFVSSRLLIFAVLFGLLHFGAHSDVVHYYTQAKSALTGHLPYNSVHSSYAPLFSYVAMVPLMLWDSPKAIIFLSLLFELGALYFWIKSGLVILGDSVTRFAVILYFSSAIPIVNVCVDGQNQVWISFFLACSLYLMIKRRDLPAGFAFGLSFVIVKFLPALFGPAYLAAAGRRWRWLLGGALFPAFVYGAFVFLGADVLTPLRTESADFTSGNLPFMISALSPVSGSVFIVLTLFGLAAVYLSTVGFLRERISYSTLIFLIGLLQLTVMLFSKKAYTNYLVISFFPLCLTVATIRHRQLLTLFLFGTFGAIAAVEPTLWFRWFDRQQLSFWSLLRPSDSLTQQHLIVFMLCEVALLCGYVLLAILCWKRARANFPDLLDQDLAKAD